MKMTPSACRALLMLSCIGSSYSGNIMKGNIFHLNGRERINIGGQEKKQVQLISSRPAKLQLLGSQTRLVSSNQRILLSNTKSALFLFSQKERNLQFASRKKVDKKHLLKALISSREKTNKARYKIKKLQRREACTDAGTAGGINFADCNLNPVRQTTTPNSKSGPFKNPNPQPGSIGAPVAQAPPEVLTTPSYETIKTTKILSSTPTDMVLTTNHSLTRQSKAHMTSSALITACTQPYATTFNSGSKGYYPKTNTATTQTELNLPITSAAFSHITMKGNNLLKMTSSVMPLSTRYRQSTSKMDPSTSRSMPSQTLPYFTTNFQGTILTLPSLVLTTLASKGPTTSSASDNTASRPATFKKDITESITFTTTLQTPLNESSHTHTIFPDVNNNAKITTHSLTRSRITLESRSGITTVNKKATTEKHLTIIKATLTTAATPHTEKYSSGTNGGFFTSPGGIAVIAVITEVTSVVLASVCIYCFVSGAPCTAIKEKDMHEETSDKENDDSDASPNTSMETLSPSISSTSSGLNVLMTPVESTDLGFI